MGGGCIWFWFKWYGSCFSSDFNSGCVWKKKGYFDSKRDQVNGPSSSTLGNFRSKAVAGVGVWCTQVSDEHIAGPACIVFCCLGWAWAWWWQDGGVLGSPTWCGARAGNRQLCLHTGGSRVCQGRSSELREDTEYISSSSKMKKAQLPHCSTRGLPKNPSIKVVEGHLIMRRMEFCLISPCSRHFLFLFGLWLLFHSRGLVTTAGIYVFQLRP